MLIFPCIIVHASHKIVFVQKQCFDKNVFLISFAAKKSNSFALVTFAKYPLAPPNPIL